MSGVCNIEVEDVNLNSWYTNDYQVIPDFPGGRWETLNNGFTVQQYENGQPTLFCSPRNSIAGTTFQGRVVAWTDEDESRPGGGIGNDDDFFGFALGYRRNDVDNISADYLLIDWKRARQDYCLGVNDGTTIEDGEYCSAPREGCSECLCTCDSNTAFRGLAVSRVVDVPSTDAIWAHTDCGDCDHGTFGVNSGYLEELARGTNQGWQFDREYLFRLDFDTDVVRVWVDGDLEIEVFGNFRDGTVCFYNYSQENVEYATFTEEEICPPEPEPPTPTPNGGKGGSKSAKTTKTTKTSKSAKSGTGKGKGGKGKGGRRKYKVKRRHKTGTHRAAGTNQQGLLFGP